MKTTRRKRKTSQNKKIKNATPNVYDGIQFKSQLETYVYKQLKAHNLKAEYEPIKFELIPSFTFCGKKIRAMTYTPDFVGDNFIIEAKGRPNDVWPYKWKWFMWSLLNKGLAEKYKLFVVHNHKETDECIRRIEGNECLVFVECLRDKCNEMLTEHEREVKKLKSRRD